MLRAFFICLIGVCFGAICYTFNFVWQSFFVFNLFQNVSSICVSLLFCAYTQLISLWYYVYCILSFLCFIYFGFIAFAVGLFYGVVCYLAYEVLQAYNTSVLFLDYFGLFKYLSSILGLTGYIFSIAFVPMGPYSTPVFTEDHPPVAQGKGQAVTKDAYGKLKCPLISVSSAVVNSGSLILRHPYNPQGIDYSVIPMIIPQQGSNIVDIGWSNSPVYVKSRPFVDCTLQMLSLNDAKAYLKTMQLASTVGLLGSGKIGQKTQGIRFQWLNQHWSYFHMDPMFMELLFRTMHERHMLLYGGLDDSQKQTYGVQLEVPSKQPAVGTNSVLATTNVTVWLPRTYVSFLLGMLLTDGSILPGNNGQKPFFSLNQGSSPLAFDLVLFNAAIHQVVGLGRGYVSLVDYYQGNPVGSTSVNFSAQLTHQAISRSMSSTVFEYLRNTLYTKPAGNWVKQLTNFDLSNFDLLALAFAILGDGGCDIRSQGLVNIQGTMVPRRNTLILGLYGFSMQDQVLLKDLLLKVTGTTPVINLKVIKGVDKFYLDWSAADTAKVSQLLFPYLPNSCPWKQHYQSQKLWAAVNPRYEQVPGALALKLLNDFWINYAGNSSVDCHEVMIRMLAANSVPLANVGALLELCGSAGYDLKSVNCRWYRFDHLLSASDKALFISQNIPYV